MHPPHTSGAMVSGSLSRSSSLPSSTRSPGATAEAPGVELHMCAKAGRHDATWRTCRKLHRRREVHQLGIVHALPILRFGGVDIQRVCCDCAVCNAARMQALQRCEQAVHGLRAGQTSGQRF